MDKENHEQNKLSQKLDNLKVMLNQETLER